VFVPAVKAPSHFYCVDGIPPSSKDRRRSTRNHFVADPAAYEALFDGWSGQRAVGEVSPAYLCTTRVPDRVAERVPDARLVAVLRNPVERAHARFVARRRDGLEPTPDLAEIVADEARGPLPAEDSAGTYVAAGFVSHVLARYLERFPRDQVQIHLHDDLVQDPAAVIHDVFAFVGVDPAAPVDLTTNRNRSGGTIAHPVTRAVWTRSAPIRTRLRRHVPVAVRDRAFAAATRDLVPEPLDAATRSRLTELYREEIERLADLLDRDLSPWLTPGPPEPAGGP